MIFIKRAMLALSLLPAVFFASDKAPTPSWHIKGSLSEACSCAVPCRCNFGGLPLPHPYCYSMYSYKIDKGRNGDVVLDGLKFGSMDNTQFYPGQSMAHIATRYVDIVQESDQKGNHLKLGNDGEFRAEYIIGRDGKTPVIVKNNTTWAIDEAIKGRTSLFYYHYGRNRFQMQDTNSNQGEFEYDSSQYRQNATAAPHCGR
jgi:hypothetical protein